MKTAKILLCCLKLYAPITNGIVKNVSKLLHLYQTVIYNVGHSIKLHPFIDI